MPRVPVTGAAFNSSVVRAAAWKGRAVAEAKGVRAKAKDMVLEGLNAEPVFATARLVFEVVLGSALDVVV